MPGSRPSSEPHNCESFLFLSGLDAKGTMTFPIDAGEETCPACKNDSCKFHGGVRTWLHHTQNSCGLCTVGFFPGLFCRLFASSRKLLIWYLWPYQIADSWADVGEGTFRKRYEVQPQHRVASWKVEWERVHSKNSQEHSKQHSVAAGTFACDVIIVHVSHQSSIQRRSNHLHRVHLREKAFNQYNLHALALSRISL